DQGEREGPGRDARRRNGRDVLIGLLSDSKTKAPAEAGAFSSRENGVLRLRRLRRGSRVLLPDAIPAEPLGRLRVDGAVGPVRAVGDQALPKRLREVLRHRFVGRPWNEDLLVLSD